jgi:hypothetical protein
MGQSYKIPKRHRRELSMGDVMPVPTVGDLRNKAAGIEGAYISVAKI